MRKARFVENCRCNHLISRLARQAFFLDGDEKASAVALLRLVEGKGLVVRMDHGHSNMSRQECKLP